MNPTPRSPAKKLTDRLAVIDSDIYKGPGDTRCSGVGCDVTDHQVLIETSVKHRTKVGASKKHLFKRHPTDFSFTKETQSIDIFPSRQELYLNRFFFFPSLLMRCNFTGMKIKKMRELILSFPTVRSRNIPEPAAKARRGSWGWWLSKQKVGVSVFSSFGLFSTLNQCKSMKPRCNTQKSLTKRHHQVCCLAHL